MYSLPLSSAAQRMGVLIQGMREGLQNEVTNVVASFQFFFKYPQPQSGVSINLNLKLLNTFEVAKSRRFSITRKLHIWHLATVVAEQEISINLWWSHLSPI
jgi:hypothetical protein